MTSTDCQCYDVLLKIYQISNPQEQTEASGGGRGRDQRCRHHNVAVHTLRHVSELCCGRGGTPPQIKVHWVTLHMTLCVCVCVWEVLHSCTCCLISLLIRPPYTLKFSLFKTGIALKNVLKSGEVQRVKTIPFQF